MSGKKRLGEIGEKKAANYLDRNGYKIIERNYKCRIGELDIIAMKGEMLVIIEVKTRSNLSYGMPCESINATKKNHILRTARYYIQCNNLENVDRRIDVIEVLALESGFYINHIENAI